MPKTFLPASVFYQDPAHRLSRGGKEMATVIPMLPLAISNEAQISFVDERSGLKGLPSLLLAQVSGSEFAQLAIDQREQVVGSMRSALLNCIQGAGNFVHGVRITGLARHCQLVVKRDSVPRNCVRYAGAFLDPSSPNQSLGTGEIAS